MKLRASLEVDGKPVFSLSKIVDAMAVDDFIKRPYEQMKLAMHESRYGDVVYIQRQLAKRQDFIDMLAKEFAVALTEALDKTD